MPSEPSKIAGELTSALGSVKEKIGNVTGNRVLEAKGAHQKARGKVQTETAKASSRREAAKHNAKGNIKYGIGKLFGNQAMQAEGKADKAYGDAKKSMNN
ncbi:glutamate decarboxylase gad1 [Entomophthora muscae]|uniref:Glutamate decarboxylase gad1 n=1 Tax=Entomophthora muscae TaxID=34485 RepID=A0ACC2ULF5_9FUNG|nr:glutamate decarboxylase gad1 [Entomophthora muscae]